MQFERGSFTAGSHVWKAFCIISISRRALCTKDAKRWPLLQIGFLHPKIEYVGLRTHFVWTVPASRNSVNIQIGSLNSKIEWVGLKIVSLLKSLGNILSMSMSLPMSRVHLICNEFIVPRETPDDLKAITHVNVKICQCRCGIEEIEFLCTQPIWHYFGIGPSRRQ